MPTPRQTLGALMLLCTLALAHAGILPFGEVQKKAKAYWAEHYPAEKVLQVEQKGGVEYTGKQTVQENTTYSDWWGTDWVTTTKEIQGKFARQVALVTVERANHSRARFEVAALYRGEGNAWQFDEITVGPVTELAAPPGVSAAAGEPSKADVERWFKAAWQKMRPDFAVESIQILAAPKLGQSGGHRWYNYQLAVIATATDKASANMRGKRYRCTPADYASVLKWENDAWTVDENMVRDTNEASVCDPA